MIILDVCHLLAVFLVVLWFDLCMIDQMMRIALRFFVMYLCVDLVCTDCVLPISASLICARIDHIFERRP